MIKLTPFFIAIVLVVSGCSSTGASTPRVSWKVFQNEAATADYCASTYTDAVVLKTCEVEFTAWSKARRECQKDTNPDYCELMASNSWKNFKSIVLKQAPTKEHADLYIVMCGHKERDVKPCTEL